MRALIAWTVIAAVSAAAILFSTPPDPRGADTPDDLFSATRAFQHVERIAARPHTWRTAANHEVRDYVVRQLGHVGFDVGVNKWPSRGDWPVENILAKRPGRASTGVVLVVCHYDSAFTAPGAGDDASAVGAVLETARILASAEPLRNDLWFLITDGEEAGLLGAWAFADQNPDIEQVRVVFNFEARGTSGRSLMFQTSPGNAELVEAYARVCPHPSACSLMADLYRRMPNNTDFTVFLDAGVPGLNFAFIEGYRHYHTPGDNPENLSLASLQHHGESMLALAHEFGERDLRQLDHTQDAVYFDVLGRLFVHYPAGWAWGLTVGVVCLFGLALWVAVRRGALTWKALGLGVVAVLRSMIYAAVIVGGLSWLALESVDRAFGPVPGTPADTWLFVAMSLLVLGTTNACVGTATGRHGSAALVAAALSVVALFLVATNAFLVGGTFLFLWPLLLLLAAWCATLRIRHEPTALAITLLYAIPVVLLLAPFGALLFSAFGLERSLFQAPLVGLWLAALAPFLDRDGGGWRRPVVLIPTALGCLTYAVALTLG